MKTLCYSVRLESLVKISDKAFRATAFDGSTDIIPASQVMGRDYDVQKSDAYWISAWILEKKNIQYSGKRQAWFDENGHQLPTYTIERHTPEKIAAKESNIISELQR
jgi:hypothetical protein